MYRAIFPLPIFLMPQGFTRLRIFEQRYLDMVKEALKNEQGFVLCVLQEEGRLNVPKHGVYVKIVDFSQGEDGQLLIDVFAEHRVSIDDVSMDERNLRHGNCSILTGPPWVHSSKRNKFLDEKLSDNLRVVFSSNPVLSDLYRDKHFDNALWVACRWLELLPISISQKEQLYSLENFEQVTDFLDTILSESE